MVEVEWAFLFQDQIKLDQIRSEYIIIYLRYSPKNVYFRKQNIQRQWNLKKCSK